MSDILPIYKPQSLTPFQCITRLKKLYPEYNDAILGYAGRLDPMAEGLLLILKNDANKHRTEYERLPKTYIFKILCGIETDTYDCMGIVTGIKQMSDNNLAARIQTVLSTYIGSYSQPYPPYSSARVDGKPLYYWSRRNISKPLPEKIVHIYSVRLKNIEVISMENIAAYAQTVISQITGDFRQETILDQWKNLQKLHPEFIFPIATCEVSCSSGTYVRSIAHSIGNTLGSGALAYHILRTQIGQYSIDDALHIT